MLLIRCDIVGRNEGNVLFKDALNTFYLWLYSIMYMVKDHSDSMRGNPLPLLHGPLFLISSNGPFICTIPETGYHISRPLLKNHFNVAVPECYYCLIHRQYSTYHNLCYTSRGSLAGIRNISMGPPWRINPMTYCTMSERSYHKAASCSYWWEEISCVCGTPLLSSCPRLSLE